MHINIRKYSSSGDINNWNIILEFIVVISDNFTRQWKSIIKVLIPCLNVRWPGMRSSEQSARAQSVVRAEWRLRAGDCNGWWESICGLREQWWRRSWFRPRILVWLVSGLWLVGEVDWWWAGGGVQEMVELSVELWLSNSEHHNTSYNQSLAYCHGHIRDRHQEIQAQTEQEDGRWCSDCRT